MNSRRQGERICANDNMSIITDLLEEYYEYSYQFSLDNGAFIDGNRLLFWDTEMYI